LPSTEINEFALNLGGFAHRRERIAKTGESRSQDSIPSDRGPVPVDESSRSPIAKACALRRFSTAKRAFHARPIEYNRDCGQNGLQTKFPGRDSIGSGSLFRRSDIPGRHVVL
jgi:hypothetical protein